MSKKYGVLVISWLAMIAIDFLLHGGILAGLYSMESPFLLSPTLAFKRIPLGYLSFLFLAIFIYYFFNKQWPSDAKAGFISGTKIGGIVWTSFGLGLYSISTINPLLVLGWIIGQTIEMGVGGYFLVMAYHSEKLSRIWLRLLIFAVLVFILTIVLQMTGIAPPMEMY